MMALNIPMQPSSKTPRMALSACSCRASALPSLRAACGDLHFFERRDVPRLVRALARFEPVVQPRAEIIVGEVLAPQGRILDARLGERAVQVEHADQARPGSRPIGDGQDRPAMRDEAAQHVMRILPDGLGHDERRLGVQPGKDLHPFALRRQEAVLFLFAIRMSADDRIALGFHGAGQGLLHFFLGRPALLVGGEPQVSAGDEIDCFFSEPLRLLRSAVG